MNDVALANGGNNSIIADNDHCEDDACGLCWWGREGVEAIFIFSLNPEAQLFL